MKDEAIPSSVPKTGDNTSLWIPALLMMLSAAGLAGMMGKRRRKRKAGRMPGRSLWLFGN
jgi:LPXTG-motif cell wall-anchored protein